MFFVKIDFLMKKFTPLDPSQKIRSEIPHQTMCLPAPHLRSDLQWRQKRSEHGNPILWHMVGIFSGTVILVLLEFKSLPLRGYMPAGAFFPPQNALLEFKSLPLRGYMPAVFFSPAKKCTPGIEKPPVVGVHACRGFFFYRKCTSGI